MTKKYLYGKVKEKVEKNLEEWVKFKFSFELWYFLIFMESKLWVSVANQWMFPIDKLIDFSFIFLCFKELFSWIKKQKISKFQTLKIRKKLKIKQSRSYLFEQVDWLHVYYFWSFWYPWIHQKKRTVLKVWYDLFWGRQSHTKSCSIKYVLRLAKVLWYFIFSYIWAVLRTWTRYKQWRLIQT